jgi:curved DNA-binding protein CbpA
MALGPDPYEVLGVPRDATGEQIAQARRRLSRELHPDVNRAPDAASRFDQVQRAFEVLSEPAARAEYDRGARDEGTAAGTAGKGAGGAKGPGAAEAPPAGRSSSSPSEPSPGPAGRN